MSKIKVQALKELERQASKIAKEKARIQAELEAEKETAKWYDQVLKESGYKRPADLIKALMGHYGLLSVSLEKKPARRGRPAGKKAANTGKKETTGRRKRTKVTPELCTKVKEAVSGGQSKLAIAKQFKVSYPTVTKIVAGGYDKKGS
jgi:hypothetical protein